MKVFMRKTLPFLLLILTLLNTSCMMAARLFLGDPEEKRLAATKVDKSYRGGACGNLLVIALTEDANQRVMVENIFTDRLTDQNLSAIVGTLKLPELKSLSDRAFLEKLAREDRIDRVLTVEIKEMADDRPPDWLQRWSASPFPEGDLDALAPPRPCRTSDVRFEIGLWDAKTLKRQWIGSTGPIERGHVLRDLPRAAGASARSLTNEKVLRAAEGDSSRP